GLRRRIAAARAQVVAEEAGEDALGLVVVEEAPRQREVIGVRRPRGERLDEELEDVHLGARLELARARELPLDRPDLVRQPEEIEIADVLRPDDRDRRARLARAARATRAVDVLLRGLREI